ncbi:unnamed protein product [Parascedosporium putredinis]|uniref:Uncharacterized protein n=1 Tax=Parascedosporium putredinis TaxID=1442378 RepID=A0A9P1H7M3_9PEZI|nr:unnamed protein product [Parascedosporium putredinis]CAI7998803.1 unnamed protein product [Parascedosporium putredinis]
MPSSSPAAAKLNGENLLNALEGKGGVKFHIKTGGAKYTAHLQGRQTYERVKATRTDSTSSSSSSSTTGSQ